MEGKPIMEYPMEEFIEKYLTRDGQGVPFRKQNVKEKMVIYSTHPVNPVIYDGNGHYSRKYAHVLVR